MDIQTYSSISEQAKQVALIISKQLSAINHNRKISLALAGGKSPIPLYQQLSELPIDWSTIIGFPTDERMVEINSTEHNGSMIKKYLKPENWLNFDLTHQTLAELSTTLQPYLPIDICVLGMGEDCHTASIFHDSPNLSELLTSTQPLLTTKSPRLPQLRISLTALTLRQATHIHLLITGKKKQQALEQAIQHATPEQAPILAITSLPQTIVHYAD